MYNNSEAVPRFYTKEAMNMADKIDVKLVLELRQTNLSQRAIAASRHISMKSVAEVWKRANDAEQNLK